MTPSRYDAPLPHRSARVNYTVSSRGQPIGTTDLGFHRLGGRSRSGWFHPNGEGEKLMPRIASVLPAMRAWFLRDVQGEDGKSIVQQEYLDSDLFADLAEKLQHTAALELTVHREDGALVPTTTIGIQDMVQLRELAQWEIARMDAEEDAAGWQPDEAQAAELEAGDEIDPDVFAVIIDAETGESERLTLDDIDVPPCPRYQIHVMLADEADVP